MSQGLGCLIWDTNTSFLYEKLWTGDTPPDCGLLGWGFLLRLSLLFSYVPCLVLLSFVVKEQFWFSVLFQRELFWGYVAINLVHGSRWVQVLPTLPSWTDPPLDTCNTDSWDCDSANKSWKGALGTPFEEAPKAFWCRALWDTLWESVFKLLAWFLSSILNSVSLKLSF